MELLELVWIASDKGAYHHLTYYHQGLHPVVADSGELRWPYLNSLDPSFTSEIAVRVIVSFVVINVRYHISSDQALHAAARHHIAQSCVLQISAFRFIVCLSLFQEPFAPELCSKGRLS